MPDWWGKLRWNPTSPDNAKKAEADVLKLATAACEVVDTPVGSGKHESMHSISAGSAEGTPIVCMPGYAAGAAFFYRNISGLSQHARVHLVDWLGTGLSGRPAFRCRTREETEDWFIDSLERWRVAQGHDKMILVGHSLGGYLSTTYALKYPDRVAHLVLVNPAGMAERPEDLELPERVRSPFSFGGAVYRVMTAAWNAGVTPGTVVRTLGPLSRRFTQGYADRRMHHSLGLPRAHCDAFEPYMFEVLGGAGSGEFALRKLLKPFAWAQYAMERRTSELRPPVTFIYGENDWMDPAAGERICKHLQAAAPDSGSAGGSGSAGIPAVSAQPAASAPAGGREAHGGAYRNRVLYIDDTSHFPFMEKPEVFNGMLLDVVGHCLPGGGAGSGAASAAGAAHHGVVADESNQGVTVDALEATFVDA